MADAASADAGQPKESRRGQVISLGVCMLTLSFLVIVLRLWARLGIQRMKLGQDDWWILVAWLFNAALTVDICTQTRFGLGQHVFDLSPDTNFQGSLELFYFGEAIYYATVAATKISILFLYIRIMPGQNHQRAAWSMMAFVALTAISCILAGLFQCDPIDKAWRTDKPGKCFNQVALYIANAGINVAQDILIYLMPVPMLWTIKVPLKQRIAIIAIFVVGGFVCIAGMVRIASLKLASVSSDPTWDNYGAAFWSVVETNVGILCASLVHFKSLVVRYAPKLLGITRSRMIELDDNPSGEGKTAGASRGQAMRTFGQGSAVRPVGILTEIDLEEEKKSTMESESSPPSTMQGGLDPRGAIVTAAASHSQPHQHPAYLSRDRCDYEPNTIQATTHVSVSFKNKGGKRAK